MSELDEPVYTIWDLIDDGRLTEVAAHLRDHLIHQPQAVDARALLALVLVDLRRLDEAEVEARQAVAEAPTLAFAHAAMGRVQLAQKRYAAAAGSGRRAMTLEPWSSVGFVIAARAAACQHQFREAVDLCTKGLTVDPGAKDLIALKALSLQLEGKDPSAAGAAWEQVLAESPADAIALAGRGWLLLEQGDRRGADEAFRAALEFDPTLEWARAGSAAVIHSRSPVYRGLQAFFDWLHRQSGGTRFAIVFGGWLVVKNLPKVTAGSPALDPVVTLITVLYATFALLTWISSFVFDGLLLLDRRERRLVTGERRRHAIAVCAQLAMALVTGMIGAFGGHDPLMLSGLMLGIALIPMSMWLLAAEGVWEYLSFGGYLGVMILGVGGSWIQGGLGNAMFGVAVLLALVVNLVGSGRSITNRGWR